MIPKKRIIPFFIPNFGCTNWCVFCNQKKITGYTDCIKPEVVNDTLSSLGLSSSETYQVAFYGGSFTVLPESTQCELLNSVQPYINSGVVSDIRISTRPDAISKENLYLLKNNGVSTIELGAQSMDDSVLAECGRGHTSNDTVNASRLIQENGFNLVLQMMTGLPGSSFEKDYYTALEISKLKPNGVRIYPTVILKNTELVNSFSAGKYQEHTVEDAVTVCSRIYPVFKGSGIPIIRIGLNPTTDLSNSEVIGGAYHPALGELVLSRVYRNEIEAEISARRITDNMTIIVPASDVSKVVGQKRINVEFFKDKYKFKRVHIIPSNSLNCGDFNLFFD